MRPLCTAGDLSVPAGGLPFITIVMVITPASSAKGPEAYLHSEPGPPRWWLNLPARLGWPRAPRCLQILPALTAGWAARRCQLPRPHPPCRGREGEQLLGWGWHGARAERSSREHRKVFRRRSRWELSAFHLSGCVSPGRRRVFHSSLSPGSQHKPPSVLVNGRGVLGGGRSLISGGTRPRGDGDGLFFSPQLTDTSWKFQGS